MADDNNAVIEMLMGFLKDKPNALGQTSNSLVELQRILSGLRKLKESLDETDPDKIKFHQVSKALTKSLISLAKLTHQNTICLLMYMSVGDFDVDATKLLTKMGKGKEAMEAMLGKAMSGENG